MGYRHLRTLCSALERQPSLFAYRPKSGRKPVQKPTRGSGVQVSFERSTGVVRFHRSNCTMSLPLRQTTLPPHEYVHARHRDLTALVVAVVGESLAVRSADLTADLDEEGCPATVSEALLSLLVDRGDVVTDGPTLRLPTHRVTLDADQAARRDRLLSALDAQPFAPPRPRRGRRDRRSDHGRRGPRDPRLVTQARPPAARGARPPRGSPDASATAVRSAEHRGCAEQFSEVV